MHGAHDGLARHAPIAPPEHSCGLHTSAAGEMRVGPPTSRASSMLFPTIAPGGQGGTRGKPVTPTSVTQPNPCYAYKGWIVIVPQRFLMTRLRQPDVTSQRTMTRYTEAMMREAIGYIRVSTARQGRSGLGLEAQRATISRFAEAEAFNLVET